MKRLLVVFSLLALAIGGCKHPSEVELVDEASTTNLEAFAVSIPDSNIATASVDSSGVLPDEEIKAAAAFLINAVTWDAGSVKKTVAYSRAFFADSVVRLSGSTVGFIGRDVGSVVLDGALMVKIPHRIPILRPVLSDSAIIRGVEYLSDLTGSYQAAFVNGLAWNAVNLAIAWMLLRGSGPHPRPLSRKRERGEKGSLSLGRGLG